MKTIVIASSKGGVGKTTLASNLAAQFARAGKNTVIVDADPQRSATRWAERRADSGAVVLPVDGTRKQWARRLPEDTQRVVVDTPAGASLDSLDAFLETADAVLVPIGPSALELDASIDFLNALGKHPRVRKGQLRVGIVANRLRPWTQASQQALALMKTWPVPLVGELRDSQAYVMLAGLGRSLFDYQSAQVREHQADYAPILAWAMRAR